MTRRCDRCRAEYESGADIGGHDYCMTCYARIKQEEEIKRMKAAVLQQQKLDYKKQQIHKQYVEDGLRRQAEEDARRSAAEAKKAVSKDNEKEMLKRMKWRIDLDKYRVDAPDIHPQVFTPIGKKKKASSSLEQKKGTNDANSSRPLQRGKADEKIRPKQAAPIGHADVSLSVSFGLPVSLSTGQKQVQAILLGKNASAKSIAVGLEVSILDSQHSPVASKSDPHICIIEPEGESKFKVEFDLPENAARGRLAFNALLKENAIYIDRPAAQSNTISLSSQVKSPMDLQYRQGSALLEEGMLVLAFNNTGESGGILEQSSSATYFPQGVDGSGKKAMLAARTKVKGGEKNIRLAFAPAEKAAIARIELVLSGKDANGKPYFLKKRIEEKKGDGGAAEAPG